MKWLFVSPVVALLAASCVSPNNGELPPLSSVGRGVAEEGTLANPVLVRDATAAIRKAMKGKDAEIVKFVVQQPVGAPGRKAWRETWVYDPEGNQKMFIMTFREDGTGSANFEIRSN
jgi:hypothetical protein